jgi:alkyl hydroperoxide reductase subunit AhpC
MATLCVGEVDCSAPLLREWLGGDWALLFSHPEDFQDQGLERDRWLEILRDEFRARGVRPVACRRASGDADGSWVGELICDHRLLRLGAAAAASGEPIDMSARSLRDKILSLAPRFVLIIDESLQRRGVLKYSAGRTTVSPLDLLASIDAFRHRSPPRAVAPERRLHQPVAAPINNGARAVA